MFTCLIHRILCIFNQFAKRNETFIIRLINTGGTSGQNLTRLRRKVCFIEGILNFYSLRPLPKKQTNKQKRTWRRRVFLQSSQEFIQNFKNAIILYLNQVFYSLWQNRTKLMWNVYNNAAQVINIFSCQIFAETFVFAAATQLAYMKVVLNRKILEIIRF